MKRRSVFFQKHHKVANCFQKILPTIIAAYATGCHASDFIDHFFESGKLVAPKIRFDWCSFADEFKPSYIELIRDSDEDIASVRRPAVSSNFRCPDIQEREQAGLARLPGDLIGVFPVPGVATNGEKVAENRSDQTAAQEGHQGLQEAFRGGFVWHFVLAVLGGLTGLRCDFHF